MTSTRTGTTWTKQIDDDGTFVRRPTTFRSHIRQDGSTAFPAVSGRYHLYVSLACPWAHRTLITRALMGLDEVISVDVVHPLLGSQGWTFEEDYAGSTSDRVEGFSLLREAYNHVDPAYEGAITVPVLWDRQERTIVNNESAEIVRMFAHELRDLAAYPEIDLVPANLEEKIDTLNAWIHPEINNGVYRCGFARSQAAYDKAFNRLFAALDRAEAILADHRYLTGDRLTEADIRLFTTLIPSTPSTTGTSSATCGGSWITLVFTASCSRSSSCPGWHRRWISLRSSTTTTRRTGPSIPPESCPGVPPRSDALTCTGGCHDRFRARPGTQVHGHGCIELPSAAAAAAGASGLG